MSDRIWISGGNGGLGRALTDAFRAAGDEVLAPGRDQLDVTEPGSVDGFFSERKVGPDLFIANAGLAEDQLLARTDESAWDAHFHTNLHGAYRCARLAARAMLKKRSGHLIFVSSHSALHPPAGQAAYAASKAALIGLGLSLARELGPAGIRVNLVLPGFLETPMTRDMDPARIGEIRRRHVLGRFNTPAAAASFMVHLHHQLPHTSGQVFRLDSRVG